MQYQRLSTTAHQWRVVQGLANELLREFMLLFLQKTTGQAKHHAAILLRHFFHK